MIRPTPEQESQLRDWRREVVASNHLLAGDRMQQIESEVGEWSQIQALDKNSKFFESFELLTDAGKETGVRTWRGLCHWLWLRHGCVHGLFFSPANMVILQRRAATVEDSPGFLDASFAGHMGSLRLTAGVGSSDRQALEAEAWEEAGIDLMPGSKHVVDEEDLKPICRYNYVEAPRPNDQFYNIEVRYVFAVRISESAVGNIQPLDREVGSFLLASIDEAWALLRRGDIASALRQSGPLALYHAMKAWGIGM